MFFFFILYFILYIHLNLNLFFFKGVLIYIEYRKTPNQDAYKMLHYTLFKRDLEFKYRRIDILFTVITKCCNCS